MVTCKDYAQFVKNKLKTKIKGMEKKPVLAIIQVGDNQASNSYVKGKIKDCEEVGIRCIVSKLDKDIEEHELLYHIELTTCAADGIIVQLPLPKHINVEHVKMPSQKRKMLMVFAWTANLIVARQKELLIGFISMAMTYAVKMLLFLAEVKLWENHL